MTHTVHRMRPTRRPNGYALLVTVVLLALIGVVLGGLARRSADTALQARAAEDAMRQRWAELSCRRSLLATAPTRFEARQNAWLAALADEDQRLSAVAQPPHFEALGLELTGLRVLLRIDDEQAKININAAVREAPATLLDPAQPANDLLADYSSSRVALTDPMIATALGLAPLESWCQTLPGAAPQRLLGLSRAEDLVGPLGGSAPAGALTLWGDGRLNILTAGDDLFVKRFGDRVSVGTIGALLDLRRRQPELLATAGLRGLIDNATEDGGERAALQSLLTERSRAYGLWLAVTPSSGSPDRTHRHRTSSDPQTKTTWTFAVIENANATSDNAGEIKVYRW